MRRARLRQLLVFGGLAWSGLVIAGWAVSLRWHITYEQDILVRGVADGSLVWVPVQSVGGSAPRWRVERAGRSGLRALGPFNKPIATWAIPGLLVAVAAWRILAQRHHSAGQCPCGYDISGLPPAPCPECGRGPEGVRRETGP